MRHRAVDLGRAINEFGAMESDAADAARVAEAGRASLAALVVARNEDAQLAACLGRLGFADEIVVVLDRSTDGSAAIARRFGARLVEGAWELEGPRRNAGIAACHSDWVLEVDADERVGAPLAAEIRAAIATAADGYFLIPMANHIGGRLVRFGWGAYNGVAAKAALFHREAKRWGAGRVHPKIELKGPKRVLRERLDHLVDDDFSDLFQRLNRDTDRAALDALEAGTRFRLATTLRRVFSRAWKSFIARKGYREGVEGLALATFSALYPLLIYLKVEAARRR